MIISWQSHEHTPTSDGSLLVLSLEEEEARALGAPWQHQELEGGEEEWNGKQYPPGKEVFIWPAKSLRRERERERER